MAEAPAGEHGPRARLARARTRIAARGALAAGLLLTVACRREPSPGLAPGAGAAPALAVALSTQANPDLATVPALLQRTLEVNRKTFEGQTGTISGFGAGEAYPQVWLRDSATLMPFTRYLYPRPLLLSWLEEHLSHQRANGELFDWIAAGRSDLFVRDAPRCRQVYRAGSLVLTADKNTSAADQESSAVRAAFLYVTITGDDAWLVRRLVGKTVLDRLDAALRFLFEERFDARLGLVTSALTADWGDVNPVYPDQRAIYMDEAAPVVGALYPNAVACRAARELAWLHERAGSPDRAREWTRRADELRRAIRRHLWQPGRGFFRMHVHSGGPPLGIDDSAMFALGGNTVAIEAGVATPEEASRIFAEAEARREEHGLRTIAGVLIPPYPEGLFRHPWLAEEYFYQNGGQWDWWAGPFVLAEFEQGHARAARRHLDQLVSRIRGAGGLYEWWTREDEGEGSAMYAGSAASIGAALVHGAFGVDLRSDGLEIRSRVCDSPAAIVLREPSTGRRVRYDCAPSAEGLSLRFETGGAAPGRLCVLLPEDRAVRGGQLDGSGIAIATEVVGEDAYACLETGWGRGDLALFLEAKEAP